jgi:hypothetical protein
MKRFLVLTIVGALSLAGGAGLALGEPTHPHTPAKPEAKKTQPPASPGKHTPSATPTAAKKSTPTAKLPAAKQTPKGHGSQSAAKKDMKGGKQSAAKKDMKGGKHPAAKNGVNWGKVGKGAMELLFGAEEGASAVAGGAEAVAGAPTVVGAVPGIAVAGIEGTASIWDLFNGGKDIVDGLGGKTK